MGLVVRQQVFLELQSREQERGWGAKDRDGSGRPENGRDCAEHTRAGGERGKALGPLCKVWRRRSGEKMIAWWSEGVQEKMGRPRARVQVPTSESEGPGASPQACLCFCISHGPGSFVSFGEE